jgi:hypothetical protein
MPWDILPPKMMLFLNPLRESAQRRSVTFAPRIGAVSTRQPHLLLGPIEPGLLVSFTAERKGKSTWYEIAPDLALMHINSKR